jgi:hypothetical protein
LTPTARIADLDVERGLHPCFQPRRQPQGDVIRAGDDDEQVLVAVGDQIKSQIWLPRR